MAPWAYAAGVVGLAVALCIGCAAQFTAMPILFFGHIAAMLVCWCLMTSGSVVYVLMGGKNRDSVRPIHAAIQSTAVLAAVVGYCCIFRNHQLMGGSQLGFDPGNPPAKTAHALLGYVVLGCMFVQAFQGWSKYFGLQIGKIRYLAHPLNGRAVLAVAALNMALVLTTFPLSQALFGALAGGILVTSAAAVILAGPAGKAAAREPICSEGALFIETEKGYEQLAADDSEPTRQ
ncbi:unnamed protein product [Symbiodinium pilosum]|uniref:Cytochrome b561 domain-containing protein n=1 Tax=Symbiodinium pilosum TaxID=2952 RepID=A0A812IUQ2_SYMPI|nr:unnamed protein product [Symbiodinium pilosum]